MNYGACFILGLVIFCLLSFAGVNFARASSCVLTDKPVRYESGTVGKHLFIPCADGRAFGLSCTHATCDPAKFGGVVTGIINAADQEAAYRAAWDAHIKWTCDAPPDATAIALCAERAAILKPPVWRVKANGAAYFRPGFTLTNGVLGTKEAGRAPVLALCDLTKPTAPAPYGDIRAQWAGGPAGVVTICTKGTP